MRKWKQKAVVQKAISFLPGRHRINYVFQKYITKGVVLTDEYFSDRLGRAREHLGAFRKHAPGAPIESTLELGTGWYPVVPVSLFLEGAQRIHTVDVSPLCGRDRLLTTLGMFGEYFKRGELARFIEPRAERWDELSRLLENADRLTMAEMLRALRIDYIVGDARRLPLPARSVSLITSNNTFEHVDPGILRQLLVEFRRLAAQGCVMSHFIDMSDHFAHFDKSITIYNYLQYSKRQWKLIDNAIQPQNRLRITDYRSIYAELGIPISEEVCRPGSIERLSTIDLHPDFGGLPLAELAVSHGLLISRMQ